MTVLASSSLLMLPLTKHSHIHPSLSLTPSYHNHTCSTTTTTTTWVTPVITYTLTASDNPSVTKVMSCSPGGPHLTTLTVKCLAGRNSPITTPNTGTPQQWKQSLQNQPNCIYDLVQWQTWGQFRLHPWYQHGHGTHVQHIYMHYTAFPS